MAVSLTPHLDNFNQEQIIALNKLIDEQENLMNQFNYLSMSRLIKDIHSSIEAYDIYTAINDIRNNISEELEDVKRVEEIADMVAKVVSGLADPIDLLNEYESKYEAFEP